MRYKVATTNKFDKELARCRRRGYDIDLLQHVVELLAETGTLPKQFKPHKLHGRYANCWECHVKSDWLLIWEQNDDVLTLLLLNTGTHADLF